MNFFTSQSFCSSIWYASTLGSLFRELSRSAPGHCNASVWPLCQDADHDMQSSFASLVQGYRTKREEVIVSVVFRPSLWIERHHVTLKLW